MDFSTLVLAPNIRVFGKPVTVMPNKSQPFGQPFRARGIWTVTQIDLVTEDGGALSSRTLKFGIRLADFAYPPGPGDWITTRACDLPIGYWQGEQFDPGADLDLTIDEFQPDGQGGATLIVKRLKK